MVIKRGGVEPPDDLRPTLVVHLKSGWGYDAKAGRFVSHDGLDVAALTDLPAGSEIVATVPELARKPATRRDPDEDRLARSYQIVLSRGVDAEEVRARLEGWECIEDAEPAPVPSLPEETMPGPMPGVPAPGMPGDWEEE